jgi:hypothetical protein
LTLSEESRLRVSENTVLRRIFGPKRDKVTEVWRKLLTHYCAGDKIEKNEMGGECSSDREGERRVQGFGGET